MYIRADCEYLSKPWNKWTVYHVGGLRAVGFSENQKYLLVVSESGRSIIDLTSLEKIARDRTDLSGNFVNDDEQTVLGITPIDSESVPVVALWKGWDRKLPTATSDGWHIDIQGPITAYLISPEGLKYDFSETPSAGEFVAIGFTDNHNQLIVASTADLIIYERFTT